MTDTARVVLLVNNWLGWKCAQFLQERADTSIAGIVLHPPGKRKYGDELQQIASESACPVWDGSKLRDPAVLEEIRAAQADVAVSVLFDYILRRPFLELFPRGVLNLHPSLLPYNRGQYPNVWSIVEKTPAGVTLMYVDEGVDTGDLIAQKRVPVQATDTGETLYRRLETAGFELFREEWPRVVAGTCPRVPQQAGEGTSHKTRDVERIDEIDLDREYVARDLVDVIRARTFPPYDGAYFRHEGRKVFLRLQLYEKTEEA